MNRIRNTSKRSRNNALVSPTNSEWQLSELVDAVAAEVDRAEDTLSLKSYARNVTFALKQLSLEMEVKVRRDANGRILFRTPNEDETSATMIKLDLSQMLQGQMHGIRKPLDGDGHAQGLNTLPGVTTDEIISLNAIAIYSVDDLMRYTQTPAMIAEVSRKSGLPEPKLRRWLHLPYIESIKPPSGAPGSQVLIEGGNFGPAPDPNATLLFQGLPVKVLSWNDGRILARMPDEARGGGVLFAIIQSQTTNAVGWDVTAVDLTVRGIEVPAGPLIAGEPIALRAVLVNAGETASANAFDVQWMIDDKLMPAQPHGVLLPKQESQESSTQLVIKLPAGQHQVRFIADPDGVHPDINRANGSFVQLLNVEPLRQLHFGDDTFNARMSLDPTRVEGRPTDAHGLLFRGLLSYQPGGAFEPCVAAKWQVDTKRTDGNLGVVFDLRPEPVWFHDGTPLTAKDVVYTYQQLAYSPYWASLFKQFLVEVAAGDNRVSFVMTGRQLSLQAMSLFTVGIVPSELHEADVKAFAKKPIGCGAYQLSSFDAKGLVLDRFEKYFLGQPRVHRVSFTGGSAEELVGLAGKALEGVNTTYTDALEQKLKDNKDLQVFALQAGEQRRLVAQVQQLRERTPNNFDSSYNAHLWYLLNNSLRRARRG